MNVKVEWWDKQIDLLGKAIYVKYSKEFSNANAAIIFIAMLRNYTSCENIAMFCNDNMRDNNEKC